MEDSDGDSRQSHGLVKPASRLARHPVVVMQRFARRYFYFPRRRRRLSANGRCLCGRTANVSKRCLIRDSTSSFHGMRGEQVTFGGLGGA